MMLGAVLKNEGFDVFLLDANAERNPHTSEEIVQKAQEIKPSVIGITLVTPLIKEAYRLASLLKKSGFKLIAGGPHATLLPEEPLRHGFDITVVGEGESRIIDAVNIISGRIDPKAVNGIYYLDDRKNIQKTEPADFISNLDELPFPARNLINSSDYTTGKNVFTYVTLFSSRGCPAKCAYCAGQLFGKRFRFRSAKHVVDEIIHAHETFGATEVHFMDDTLTVDRNRVKEICQRIKDSKLPISWSMMTRIDLVDEELLTVMAESGCKRIDYGVESGHPETLRKIHKPHTVEMVRKVIPLTAKAGIKSFVFFILGFPWDTPESLETTRQFMLELSPYVESFHPAVASILIPFPGTEIYETYREQYQLDEWWLSETRCYDAPHPKIHPYFMLKMFVRGAVLDADFFHYTPETKKKIHSIFKFMYTHNLKKSRIPIRLLRHSLINLSEMSYSISPNMERWFFRPVIRMEQWAKSSG
jgi:radical SAM superfamily enzyme YgiQ (UPF0313 family)